MKYVLIATFLISVGVQAKEDLYKKGECLHNNGGEKTESFIAIYNADGENYSYVDCSQKRNSYEKCLNQAEICVVENKEKFEKNFVKIRPDLQPVHPGKTCQEKFNVELIAKRCKGKEVKR